MSRHRNVRNLNLVEYLDDDDYDDGYNYDDDDDDDDDAYAQQYQYQSRDTNNINNYLEPSSQPATNQQQPPADNLDDDLLNDMVDQFRTVLNDRTLSTAQVSNALTDADYDWEIALATLRSLQQTHAQQADPSPIAQLLAVDDNDDQTQKATTRLPPISLSVPGTLGASETTATPAQSSPSKINYDYDSFIEHSGTVLINDRTTPSHPPFQFDKPSPDDIIRAKQARGTARTVPSLRPPKPASGASSSSSRTRAGGVAAGVRQTDVKMNNNSTSLTSASNESKQQQSSDNKTKPLKPLKPLRPAKPPRPTHQQQNQSINLSSLKQRTKKVNTDARVSNDAASVSVVVAGHVDAGKSTLIGHLIQQLSASSVTTNSTRRRRGNSGASNNLAWDTDDDRVERERGVTIDIASRFIRRPGPTPRTIALIDAPGHRDFVPAMIVGASHASAALLVVDASEGEFEAGFSDDGQTKEHAIVLKSFGVSRLVVVVNKMDVAEFSKLRFDAVCKTMLDFLRSNGWKPSQVSFVPVSGREGVNLTAGPPVTHPLAKWYHGASLIAALDAIPVPSPAVVKQALARPTRLVVSDLFRSAALGGQLAVSGRLLAGSIAQKDKLVCVPGHAIATIKTVTNAPNRGAGFCNSSNNQNSVTTRSSSNNNQNTVAIATLDAIPISLALTDLPDTITASDAGVIQGSVLCDPEHVCPAAKRVRARVLVTGHDALVIRGTRGVLHIGASAQEAHVAALCEYVSSSNSSNGNGNGNGNGTSKNNKSKSSGGGKGKAQSTTGKNKPNNKKRNIRKLVKGDSAIIEIACDRAVALETADNGKELARFALRQGGRTVLVGMVQDVLETEKVSASDETDKELPLLRRL